MQETFDCLMIDDVLDTAGVGFGFLRTEMKGIHEELFKDLVTAVYIASSFNACGMQSDKTVRAVIDEALFCQRFEGAGHGRPPDIQAIRDVLGPDGAIGLFQMKNCHNIVFQAGGQPFGITDSASASDCPRATAKNWI